ncbi:hypothetical protein [Streptomyces xinghaiensis]|uniref:hypothetical protein n=1 Tax=Streptomyces xinghaiensis TaxID=1038928 RepID=UPI0002EFE8C7|nr:hypothetical protein [Streptomyces xinghaiensis]
MPVPTDPRTPQQRINDQLKAARRRLSGPHLSHAERCELADRIRDLEAEAHRIGA